MNNQTVRIDIVPRLEDAALAQISDKLNKLSTNLQNYGKILITPELNGKAFMDVLEKFNK